MNKVQIREKLKDFLGEEKFNKFFDAFHKNCRHHKRLMYWQEQLWSKFLEDHSLEFQTFADIENIFMFCRVHGNELQEDEVDIIAGTRVVSSKKEYDEEKEKYPFAKEYVLGHPMMELNKRKRKVFFCPQCRKEKGLTRK